MAECNDKKCPVHGNVKVRGNIITGMVVSTKPSKTAVIERVVVHKIPKYERYMKKRSRVSVHNPPCINAKTGDMVEAGECRKLSKTKAFTIIKKEAGEKK
jgi:small subunit ribosomal protein S17